MLTGKNIVLGVTGSIAAWRACPLCIELSAACHANVDIIMTAHAQQFMTALTLRNLSHNPVVCDQFERPTAWDVKHISLAHKADLFLVAPCTANMIGKLASGIADDMLSTTVMATKAPVVLCPAMDEQMYMNPVVQENIAKLKDEGFCIVEPAFGTAVSDGTGSGIMADVSQIVNCIVKTLASDKTPGTEAE